jgi:ubiquinone/menaquinone biosynthesis C-methylase UbiE
MTILNLHVLCDILGVKGKLEVLREAHRILKDNGVIVLDLPDREKGNYKKDGIYINHPGGEAIFVGYIPSDDEMRQYLEKSGFTNITIKKWETKNGFPKVTYIAKKNTSKEGLNMINLS